MRLTPSWLRSSSGGDTDERSGDSETTSGFTLVYSPESDFSTTDTDETRAREFIPESDTALVAVLDEMNTPVTVDEVTDELTEPARLPIETWATVHERLHQDRLPALDAAGAIEFDETQGVIERSTARTNENRLRSSAVLVAISLGLLCVVIALISVSVLIS